jgi:hypothetical protein
MVRIESKSIHTMVLLVQDKRRQDKRQQLAHITINLVREQNILKSNRLKE